LSGLKCQIVELLGLFTAIISFTVGSIQLVLNQIFAQGAMLLIVFSGCILIIYGGLGIILYGRGHLKRTISVLIMGLLLVVLPIIYISRGL
jgi:hypothetical protein